ncbi:formamidopyrimidine-DNA glycosylase [Allomyces macrogynus ATCC 38327]|uniref:Formamidopyrimidine-DNA glycosylase n=1 Tax=Allomyces macrogynus (strain ATCC 38327) TaxID=578462 RepID=A0A0L0TCR9_ALLM3|nr:formamidopyrimidine-DNA glycosylase [Allomyces macrogynus ATCC 38327]|eukprot:KNE72466.1 formamidopyrimidine-DNA glycosylase [Allomyces macrogynus ATCC 38327]
MPELPEVEKTRSRLGAVADGQQIVDISSFEDTIVYNIPHTDFATRLRGATLIESKRYGKWMYCPIRAAPTSEEAHADAGTGDATEADYYLFLHLGMTGNIRVRGNTRVADYRMKSLKYDLDPDGGEVWPPRWCKFTLTFANGAEVAFCDPRRLGKIWILEAKSEKDVKELSPLKDLGFDPVHCMPSTDEFAAAVSTRKCPIKALLLDQAFSAGIGNWIADEVLYQSKIHPARRCHMLTRTDLDAIHAQIVAVNQIAIEANANATEFPNHWLFHRRWGKGGAAVKTVDGNVIKFVTVGGRTSAYVPAVQPVPQGAEGAVVRRAKSRGGAAGTKRKRRKVADDDEEEKEDGAESDSSLSSLPSHDDEDELSRPHAAPKRETGSQKKTTSAKNKTGIDVEGLARRAVQAA